MIECFYPAIDEQGIALHNRYKWPISVTGETGSMDVHSQDENHREQK